MTKWNFLQLPTVDLLLSYRFPMMILTNQAYNARVMIKGPIPQQSTVFTLSGYRRQLKEQALRAGRRASLGLRWFQWAMLIGVVAVAGLTGVNSSSHVLWAQMSRPSHPTYNRTNTHVTAHTSAHQNNINNSRTNQHINNSVHVNYGNNGGGHPMFVINRGGNNHNNHNNHHNNNNNNNNGRRVIVRVRNRNVNTIVVQPPKSNNYNYNVNYNSNTNTNANYNANSNYSSNYNTNYMHKYYPCCSTQPTYYYPSCDDNCQYDNGKYNYCDYNNCQDQYQSDNSYYDDYNNGYNDYNNGYGYNMQTGYNNY